MLDKVVETFITIIITIGILGGTGFVFWWAGQTIKRNCSNSDCCKKKLRWECKKCGDVVSSDTQPYCKTCSHIERIDIKMEKLENK